MSRALQTGGVCIVCEGEKTEPSFFADLHVKLKDLGVAHITTVDFYKVPQPKEQATRLDNTEVRSEGGRAMNVETSKPVSPTENYAPLNWIKIANEKLGAYSEAWAVFDNDHRNSLLKGVPHIDNALAVYRGIGNSNLHIAYSSLSFEYYMLQHFDLLYHAFKKTECYENVNGHHKYLNCCSTNPQEPPLSGACDGILTNDCCINGYARKNGYWSRSKAEGTFARVQNIYRGVINAAKIRWEAVQRQRGISLGNMNPYLNTYQLTLRMMGMILLEYDNDVEVPYKGGKVLLRLFGDKVRLTNLSTVLFLLPSGCDKIYCPDMSQLFGLQEKGTFGRFLVYPQESVDLDLSLLPETGDFAILKIERMKILITALPAPNPALAAAEKDALRLA